MQAISDEVLAGHAVEGAPAHESGCDSAAPVGLFSGYGDFLLVQDVAREMGVCVKTVRNWAKSGRIPSVKMGNRVLIPKARFVALLESMSGGGVDA